MPRILNSKGQPYKSEGKSVGESAWEALQKLGITRDNDGSMKIPPEALARIRSERMRNLAVTSVPSTPRYLQRDAGGIGVAKAQDRVRGITLEGLRLIRERSPLLQVIHAARQYQVRHLARKWNGQETGVGWRVVHRDHLVMGRDVPDEIKHYIGRFERLLERPAPAYGINSARTLMGALMEDLLTINRPVVEHIHSLLEPKRVVQLRPVDGAMIWPTLVWVEKWKTENPGWNRGYDPNRLTTSDELAMASAALQFDLAGAEYAIVRDGLLEGVAPPGRLTVGPIVNRTAINHVGYWPSHVEQAIDLTSAFIRAFDYNAHFFTRGMMSEFAIALMGDIHDDDAKSFIDQLRESSQGVDTAWQPPVIQLPSEGSVTTIPFKENKGDMQHELWSVMLAAFTTGIYRMHLSTINAKSWDPSGGGKLSEGSDDTEINLAQEEGLQGDVQHLTDEILTPAAQRCHPDLMVIWEYGNVDPKVKADLFDVRTNIDWSPNDVRVMEGKTPRGYYLDDDTYAKLDPEDEQRVKHDTNPWNWPKQGPIQQMGMQAAQAEQQQKQMEQQQQHEQEMGRQGQPTGWGDDQDGYGGPEDQDDGYGQAAEQKPFGPPAGGAKPPGGPPPGPSGGGPKPPAPPKPPMAKASRRRPLTVAVYHIDEE